MTWAAIATAISLATVQMPTVTIDFSRVRETVNESFYPMLGDQHRYLNLIGGSGSGKSVFVAQKKIYRIASEPGHRILVIRKVAKTLRESRSEERRVGKEC